MNIKDSIGKGFGYRNIAYSIGVNAYFPPRRTNKPHETPNYVPGKSKSKFIITDRHIALQNTGLYPKKIGKHSSIRNVSL